MRHIIIPVTCLALLSVPAAASGRDDKSCTSAPREQWLKLEEIGTKLSAQGYALTEIELEGQCVEAKVTTKDGVRQKLYVNPANGEILVTKSRKK